MLKKTVRIIAIIILLSTTTLFVLKLWFIIPIQQRQLLGLFIVGAISFVWANSPDRDKK